MRVGDEDTTELAVVSELLLRARGEPGYRLSLILAQAVARLSAQLIELD